jgi:hypothetical protein
MWAPPRSRSTAFYRYMLEHGGLVVADPAATMAAYCAAVGIPFSRPALRWVPVTAMSGG